MDDLTIAVLMCLVGAYTIKKVSDTIVGLNRTNNGESIEKYNYGITVYNKSVDEENDDEDEDEDEDDIPLSYVVVVEGRLVDSFVKKVDADELVASLQTNGITATILPVYSKE